MAEAISKVCFLGIYGHNQDDVLRDGLAGRDVEVVELTVPRHSLAEARERKRMPILTMRATMSWFGGVPAWLFPFLVAATLLVHGLAIGVVTLAGARRLRGVDAVVVPHMGDTSVLFAKPVAVVLGVPLVYVSHNGLYFTLVENRGMFPRTSVAGRFLWQLDRLMHRLADHVVVFSDESGRQFGETFGIPESTYTTIYISAPTGELDRSLEPDADHDADCLYWGNYHPHHGPEEMVRAAAALPEHEFVFLGASSKRAAVVELAEELDAENVSFPGFVSRDELVRYIRAAGAVFGPVGDNPQTEFTIGTKVAEAAYLGKAIVVGQQPAIEEVFTHREDAYLVEPGTPESLADGVEDLLADDDLRHRLERGAADAYDEHLSSAEAGRRFLAMLA